jgi:two-component system sensor histidine kinase RegB
MSVESGQAVGESLVRVTAERLIESVLEELPAREAVLVGWAKDCRSVVLRVPLNGLAQALRGIVQNALDASPDGCGVRLQIGCQGGQLQLDVADAGPGLAPETLRRIGEPFFTTKPPGQGTGLGVFLARTVVERLGGGLEFQSSPGCGTTASIRLPFAGGEGAEV